MSVVQDGVGTDDQNLSLVGNTLSIENGNSVNLAGFVDTDDQQLSLTGTTLSLEDGGSVDLSSLKDGMGTDDQQLSLAGTTLSLEDGGSVDLSGLQDGIGTDDQLLSLSGTTLSIESGNSVDLSTLQDGTGTDDQLLSLSGTTLSIESGNSVDLSTLQDGTGTDDQQLSLAGTTLSLEDGGSVDLSLLQDGTGTDDQQLSLASNILSLEDGGSVDLSPYLDNTDDQQLSLSGTTLSLEDGGSVNLSALQDGNDNIYNLNGALPINTIRTLGFGNAASRYRYLDPNNTGNYFEFFNNITSGFNAGIFFNDDDESLTATIGQLGQGVYGIQTESFSVATVKGGFASLINANGDAWFNVDDSGDETRMFSTSANYLIGNPGTASSLLQNNNTISRIMAYDHTTGRVYWRDLATMGDGTGTDHQGLSLTGNILSIDNANSVDLSTISIAKDYAWSENTGSSTIAVTSGVQNGFDSTYGITETTSTANFTYTAINGRWTYNGPDDTPFLVNIKARMITSAKLCDIEMRLLSSTGALSNDSYVSGDGGSDEFFLGTNAVVVLDSGDYIYSTFISGYSIDTTVNDFSLVISEL
ncbi:MAG: hypothetical protein DWQ02_06225 [Bacteroidetes bacterium]|nr:MAG: hypothetical protein DWQ02_06225 [Bacteroidota bacterium]